MTVSNSSLNFCINSDIHLRVAIPIYLTHMKLSVTVALEALILTLRCDASRSRVYQTSRVTPVVVYRL